MHCRCIHYVYTPPWNMSRGVITWEHLCFVKWNFHEVGWQGTNIQRQSANHHFGSSPTWGLDSTGGVKSRQSLTVIASPTPVRTGEARVASRDTECIDLSRNIKELLMYCCIDYTHTVYMYI